MEINEIEKYVGICKSNCIPQSEKVETLNIIQSIVCMRGFSGNFCKVSFDEMVNRGIYPEDAYRVHFQHTMEDEMAQLAISLFKLANKYHMDLEALRIDGKTPSKNFEDLVYSMVKIGMTHYRIQKKIIILIGMLCNFCVYEGIDLLWFVKYRLLINVK